MSPDYSEKRRGWETRAANGTMQKSFCIKALLQNKKALLQNKKALLQNKKALLQFGCAKVTVTSKVTVTLMVCNLVGK
ncbi:MAG: hypothetical protein KC421_01475 [Anaerolineales bacterium]|nr:hypothetical protein [Anaerolineales bacterium]